MKVCGFTSLVATSSIRPRPTSELHSRLPTAIPSSWANLSINMNPRLCRVHSYSFPGFPKPTINISDCQLPIADCLIPKLAIGNWQSAMSSFPFALFFLLALTNDFRLGGLFTFSRRRRRDLFLHDADSGNHELGIRQYLDSVRDRNIGNVQRLVYVEIGDIDLDRKS